MSGTNCWRATDYPALAAVAVASQAALPNASVASQTVRARTIVCSVAGAAAAASGIIKFVLRDGASGFGAIIWSAAIGSVAGGSESVTWEGDLRASVGNALTLETTGAPATGCQVAVSMTGDYIAAGAPVM